MSEKKSEVFSNNHLAEGSRGSQVQNESMQPQNGENQSHNCFAGDESLLNCFRQSLLFYKRLFCCKKSTNEDEKRLLDTQHNYTDSDNLHTEPIKGSAPY